MLLVRLRFGAPEWFKGAAQRIDGDPDTWAGMEDDGEIAWGIIFDYHHHTTWYDHGGWSGEGEDSVLVSEPYALDQSEIKELIAFCDKHDFQFEILGKSSHYPSATIRIEISPKVVHPFKKYETPADFIAHVRVFQMKNRLIACDILEHALRVVPEGKQRFFRNAIACIRHFANGDEDYRTVVDDIHKRAEKKYREWSQRGNLAYTRMLLALTRLSQPEEPLSEMEQFGMVRVNAADAVEAFDNYEAGVKERNWQHELLASYAKTKETV